MLHLFLEFPSVLSNFCASKYLIITCPRNILAAEQTVSAAVVLMVTCINTANFLMLHGDWDKNSTESMILHGDCGIKIALRALILHF
jgi:hypothetical protein